MFAFFNELFNGTPHQHLKEGPMDHDMSSMGECDSNSSENQVQYQKRVEGRKRLREKSTKAEMESKNNGVKSNERNYVIVTDNSSVEVSLERPAKKIRLVGKEESKLLQMIPTEVLQNILSYCGSAKDRFSVQVTCKTFQRISNDSSELLANVVLGGDINGRGSLLREEDTPETASIKLTPYCQAGNLEAIYMLGMIKSYCLHDVEKGISLLKLASKRGFVRATYTLGLILRDIKPREARRYMTEAAELGYLPALQEVLPARELKDKFGEPSAAVLCQYLDPTSLNRLLGRYYVLCPHLRDIHTSHCWNPLCGRWAHRAHHANMNNADRSRRLATISKDQTPSTPVAVYKTRVSRMKMCSRCCRAKYCSKLCQVYDWRSGRHKVECPFL